MSSNDRTQGSIRQSMKRRDFLQRAGWGSVGVTGLIIGAVAHGPWLTRPLPIPPGARQAINPRNAVAS